MLPHNQGGYVAFSDYASLQKELAERTKELIIAPAECGDNCDDPDCPYAHTPLTLRQAYENAVSRIRAAEARADALAQEVERLSKALGDAERRLVSLYDGIAPQAHYENELGINGHRTGNRHADNDEVVQRIRAAIGDRP